MAFLQVVESLMSSGFSSFPFLLSNIDVDVGIEEIYNSVCNPKLTKVDDMSVTIYISLNQSDDMSVTLYISLNQSDDMSVTIASIGLLY